MSDSISGSHTEDDNKCPSHNFEHLSYKAAVITNIKTNYNNDFVMFQIGGEANYGVLKALVTTADATEHFAIEMVDQCENGYNKSNHHVFTCDERRGVLVSNIDICVSTGNHLSLHTLSTKVLANDSICCLSALEKSTILPNLKIGDKCKFRVKHFKKYIGVCKWIGKVNDNVECIGVETTTYLSSLLKGVCEEIKIFDCREGHGLLLKANEIEMDDSNELDLDDNGMVILKSIYYAKKADTPTADDLQIGRRAEVLFMDKKIYGTCGSRLLFGVVKWIGTINKGLCVGIELDYPLEGGMDGVINSSESFECEQGHGVVCAWDSVAFDSYIYSEEFTVGKTINLNSNLCVEKNWKQKIAEERHLKEEKNVYVYIDKEDRILQVKGRLEWMGFIQGVSVAKLKMKDEFPTFIQKKIEEDSFDSGGSILVNTQYLFRFRELKSYEKREDDILKADIGSKTDFGILKWKGIKKTSKLYYGFEVELPSANRCDCIHYGQTLFECTKGTGILLSVAEVSNYLFEVSEDDVEKKPKKVWNFPYSNHKEFMELLFAVADKGGVTPNELLSTASSMESERIMEPLIDNMTSHVNIYKYAGVIESLLTSKSFGTLEASLADCSEDSSNDEQLLKVAFHSLKEGNVTLFEKCIAKCTDCDYLMSDGETLMTIIIKEKVNQHLIIKAINTGHFDLFKRNKDNEIPVTLALENGMLDLVHAIAYHGSLKEKINSQSRIPTVPIDISDEEECCEITELTD